MWSHQDVINLNNARCTANTLYQKLETIFPEMTLRGLVPISYIISVSDLCIPTIDPPIMLQ
jgi:hypothetical protein